MIAYFSTVKRGAAGVTGEFVCVDWSTKVAVATSPVVSGSDLNPRGGRRGGRGVWASADEVYGATDDTLLRWAPRLTDVRIVPTGWVQDAHEVFSSGDQTLWIAANRYDAALCIDMTTGSTVRELTPCFKPALAADGPLRYQMTALAMWKGELHALCARPGIIVNLETPAVVVRNPLLHLAHNLVIVGDRAFVNSTPNRLVCEFDLTSSELVRSVDLSGLDAVRNLPQQPAPPEMAQPLFVRGLSVVGNDIYVGISPATILHLRWSDGELIDLYQHSEDVHVAVHGLCVVPD